MPVPIVRKLLRTGAIPGANLGATFTASLVEQSMNPDNAYLDRFEVSCKAATATAAVTMRTFLALLQPFAFNVNGLPRFLMRAGDMYGLNAAFLNRTPGGFVADDINDDIKYRGLWAPVWLPISPATTYSYYATRVAQTNVSSEVITIASRALDKIRNLPLHSVEIQYTTAGSTGLTTAINELPRLGDLRGILVFNTTVPTNTADSAGTQHLQIKIADVLAWSSGFDDIGCDDDVPINGGNEVATDWGPHVLDQYRWVDFRDSPVDARNNKVTIDVDVQTTSEAARFIPVYQLPVDIK